MDILYKGTDFLLIDSEGMRGTGIAQRVLLIIGWDGERFRTVAAETLNYRCGLQPQAPVNFLFNVHYSLQKTASRPSLRFKYTLEKNGKALSSWSDVLYWDQTKFIFTPSGEDTVLKNRISKAIQQEIAQVRDYLLTHPLNPESNSYEWLVDSGLMSVLNIPCEEM